MRHPALYAAIYDQEYDPTANKLLANFSQITDVNISWETAKYGTSAIELLVKAPSALSAYDWYRRFALQRLVIYDSYVDKPIATGDITGVGYRWGTLAIRAQGPGWRLYDGLENTAPTSGMNNDDVIRVAYLAHASATVDSNTDHLQATTAAVTYTMPSGTATSTSSYKLVDSGADFSQVRVGDIARDTTGGSFTTISLLDSGTQLSVTENIFASGDGYVIYRPVASGTTTSTIANYLLDSKADFFRARITAGDYAFNITDTTSASVSSILGKTTIQLASNIFVKGESYIFATPVLRWTPDYDGDPVADVIRSMLALGDGTGKPIYFWLTDQPFYAGIHPRKLLAHLSIYSATHYATWQIWRRDMARNPEVLRDFTNLWTSIQLIEPDGNAGTAQTNNTSTYWTRSAIHSGYGAIPSMAEQRALTEVNQLSDGTLRRPLYISAPRIKDGKGFRWPLWRMIAGGGGYLRVNDMFPDATLVQGAGYDRERQGRITTMDYNYGRNLMRVTLDDDTRADRRIRDLGFDESLQRRLRQAGR